jgi:hypothetical protein
MKRCRKMKRRQRVRLDSMRKRCDTVWWCDDVDRRKGEETTTVALMRILLGQKIKKIHTVDSAGTNAR